MKIEIDIAKDRFTMQIDDTHFDGYEVNGIWMLTSDVMPPYPFRKKDTRKAMLAALEKALTVITGGK